MTRPFATIRSSTLRKAMAFTLIELMVVIGIIVLMMTILVLGTRAMTEGNSIAQANNVVAAYLSNARAVAMQRGGYAGVAFFEDPAYKAQTAMRIVVSDPSMQTGTNLIPLRADLNYDIQYLPRDMNVGVLDGAAGGVAAFRIPGEGAANDTNRYLQSRVVLFDANGREIVRDGLTSTMRYASLTYVSGNTYYRGDIVAEVVGSDINCYVCLADSTATDPSTDTTGLIWHKELLGLFAYTGGEGYGRSSPALVLYDAIAFRSANGDPGDVGFNAVTANTWLQQNGKLVTVNAYTGSLQ